MRSTWMSPECLQPQRKKEVGIRSIAQNQTWLLAGHTWKNKTKQTKKMMEFSLNGGLEFLEHHGETFALKYLAQSYF